MQTELFLRGSGLVSALSLVVDELSESLADLSSEGDDLESLEVSEASSLDLSGVSLGLLSSSPLLIELEVLGEFLQSAGSQVLLAPGEEELGNFDSLQRHDRLGNAGGGAFDQDGVVVDDVKDHGDLAGVGAEIDEHNSANLDEEIFLLVLSDHS